MELCCLCNVLWGCALLYIVLQFIRILRSDGDLSLLWAELFGSSPGYDAELQHAVTALQQILHVQEGSSQLYQDSAFTEKELSGKVVWVTGASSGIGEELSYQLAKLGAILVLSARRVEELHRVKQKCLEISGLQKEDILVLTLDLVKKDSHESAATTVLHHFGRIDVLINNGGRSQRSLFVDTSLDVYEALIQINYLGTISLTKCVLKHMIERKKGKIVNVSSVTGLVGVPLSTGYAASKHALQGFFNSLRIELYDYPDIMITNICPGPVQSKVVDNAFAEEVNKTPDRTDQSYKMPTARCVQLMLVSIANNLKETWIADQPYLFVYYLWQYMPTWAWWITEKIGRKRIQNFKDGLDADSAYFTTKAKAS